MLITGWFLRTCITFRLKTLIIAVRCCCSMDGEPRCAQQMACTWPLLQHIRPACLLLTEGWPMPDLPLALRSSCSPWGDKPPSEPWATQFGQKSAKRFRSARRYRAGAAICSLQLDAGAGVDPILQRIPFPSHDAR